MATTLALQLGYSHPGVRPSRGRPGPGRQAPLRDHGIDKEKVGQAAAEIRALRTPEPYKGKGIRYPGEDVRRKAGKTREVERF